MSEPVQRIVFALLVEDGRSGAAEKSALRAPTDVRRRPPIALQPVIQVVDHQTFGIEPRLVRDEPGFEGLWKAVQERMHVHDLHATILHLMGLDHEALTYRYSGRDFRLTDVQGQVATGILA